MPYLPNECSKQQWKYFYQRYIPFRRCTHLCLRTDVQCGEDNYFYRNTTEFLYQPTAAVNPLMFAPSFSGKQYGVVDQRFVYQMDQCREVICARLCATLSIAMPHTITPPSQIQTGLQSTDLSQWRLLPMRRIRPTSAQPHARQAPLLPIPPGLLTARRPGIQRGSCSRSDLSHQGGECE